MRAESQDNTMVRKVCYILPHWECLGIISPFLLPLLNEKTIAQL
jgi:hypothetical protein